MHLQCVPIKKYYGCAGYVDDPLPNIACIVPMALLLHYKVLLRVFLHFMALHAFHLYFVVFSGQLFFFMLSVSIRLLYTK